jgi:hypothetical protein
LDFTTKNSNFTTCKGWPYSNIRIKFSSLESPVLKRILMRLHFYCYTYFESTLKHNSTNLTQLYITFMSFHVMFVTNQNKVPHHIGTLADPCVPRRLHWIPAKKIFLYIKPKFHSMCTLENKCFCSCGTIF